MAVKLAVCLHRACSSLDPKSIGVSQHNLHPAFPHSVHPHTHSSRPIPHFLALVCSYNLFHYSISQCPCSWIDVRGDSLIQLGTHDRLWGLRKASAVWRVFSWAFLSYVSWLSRYPSGGHSLTMDSPECGIVCQLGAFRSFCCLLLEIADTHLGARLSVLLFLCRDSLSACLNCYWCIFTFYIVVRPLVWVSRQSAFLAKSIISLCKPSQCLNIPPKC